MTGLKRITPTEFRTLNFENLTDDQRARLIYMVDLFLASTAMQVPQE